MLIHVHTYIDWQLLEFQPTSSTCSIPSPNYMHLSHCHVTSYYAAAIQLHICSFIAQLLIKTDWISCSGLTLHWLWTSVTKRKWKRKKLEFPNLLSSHYTVLFLFFLIIKKKISAAGTRTNTSANAQIFLICPPSELSHIWTLLFIAEALPWDICVQYGLLCISE